MRRSFQTNRFRLLFAKVLFLSVFIIVAGRAFQLQVLQGGKLKRLGERQHLKEWIVLPKRGALLDRTGEPLALSLESQSVYARPHRIQDGDAVSRKLAKILNLNVADVAQKIASDKPFVWIKRQVAPPRRNRYKPSMSMASACSSSPIVTIRKGNSPDKCWGLSVAIRKASRGSSYATTTTFGVRRAHRLSSGTLLDGEFWCRAWRVCRSPLEGIFT